MLYIRKFEDKDWEAVKQLGVNDRQVNFVSSIEVLFTDPLAHWHFHVIEVGDEIVGFFNIDINYASQYTFSNNDEIGLRSFFISTAHQGKGYGTLAVKTLEAYFKKYYPEYSSLCLTVNCKNVAAYKCYLKGGFEDTGELYTGGAAGPQHIMRMSIS